MATARTSATLSQRAETVTPTPKSGPGMTGSTQTVRHGPLGDKPKDASRVNEARKERGDKADKDRREKKRKDRDGQEVIQEGKASAGEEPAGKRVKGQSEDSVRERVFLKIKIPPRR